MQAWHLWVIIGIIFSILEIFTAGFLIINFGIGAFITALAAGLGFGFRAQILTFAVSSLIFFIFIRRIAMRYLTKDKPEGRTNVDALIGRTGIVTAAVGGTIERGSVKIGGEEWSAVSEVEREIGAGSKIVVTGVDGNKLIVRPEE